MNLINSPMYPVCTSVDENNGICSVYVWKAWLPGFLGSEYDFEIASLKCGSSKLQIFTLCKKVKRTLCHVLEKEKEAIILQKSSITFCNVTVLSIVLC